MEIKIVMTNDIGVLINANNSSRWHFWADTSVINYTNDNLYVTNSVGMVSKVKNFESFKVVKRGATLLEFNAE